MPSRTGERPRPRRGAHRTERTEESEMAEPTHQEIDRFVGAAHGDLATVRAFVDAHPEHINTPSSMGETALQAAAHTGQRAIAEFLLERGAPLDICAAAMLGRNDQVR